MRGLKTIIVAGLVLGLAATAFSVSSAQLVHYCGWFMPSGNSANTCSVATDCSPSKHRVKKFWEQILTIPARQLLEGNGKVYVADDDGLTCFTSSNGKLLWKTPVNKPTMVGIWSDRVCVNSNGLMMGFDASNGRKKWEKKGLLLSISEGQVYYTKDDIPGILVAGSMADGAEFWQYKVFPAKYQSEIQKIAIAGKNCLILSKDWTDPGIDGKTLIYESSLHLINSEDGKIIWKKSIGVDNYAYLGIVENTVVINLKDIGLTLLELDTGKIIWFSSIAPDMTNSTVSLDGIKIISQLEKTVCLAAQTGKKLWTRDIGSSQSSLPILSGEHIWCSISGEPVVSSLSSRDGKTLWWWGPKSEFRSTLVVGDGKVLALWNNNTTLTALVDANDKIVFTLGSEDWQLDGVRLKTKAIPALYNKIPYVSATLVLGNLGAHYTYNQAKKELTINFNGKSTVLTVGKSTIIVDGTKRQLDKDTKNTPQLINGYFMIPAKSVGDLFGIKTYINLKNKMIAFNASSL